MLFSAGIRFLPSALLAGAAPAQESAESRFVAAAESVEHLTPSDLVYDRLPEIGRLAAETPPADLVRLLDHPRSRVRALALAAMYWKGDPALLPAIVEKAGDEGEAPPARLPNHVALEATGRPTGPLWSTREQTVGRIARAIAETYLAAAGFHAGIEGRDGRPGFAAYWEERRGRRHCLSWFAVAHLRATQGTWPVPRDRVAAIAALRAEIDALESPWREWALLALASPWETGPSEPSFGPLASEGDLVEAARRLGDERIARFLRGEDPFPEDPDMRLRPDDGPYPFGQVAPFLLRHARESLVASRAPELLRLEARHLAGEPVGGSPRSVTARWAAAAADLDPGRAREILRAAFVRFREGETTDRQDHRAILAEALWRHAGESEIEFLKDWFFGEVPQRGAFGFGRHRIADALGRPEDRALLLAILLDPRLAEVDWQTLRRLALAANASAGREVVPEEEMRDLGHPLGEGHYHWEKERARETYPLQTEALESALAGWRERLAAYAREAR